MVLGCVRPEDSVEEKFLRLQWILAWGGGVKRNLSGMAALYPRSEELTLAFGNSAEIKGLLEMTQLFPSTVAPGVQPPLIRIFSLFGWEEESELSSTEKKITSQIPMKLFIMILYYFGMSLLHYGWKTALL